MYKCGGFIMALTRYNNNLLLFSALNKDSSKIFRESHISVLWQFISLSISITLIKWRSTGVKVMHSFPFCSASLSCLYVHGSFHPVRSPLGYNCLFFFVIIKLLLIFKYIIACIISSTISKHLRYKDRLFLDAFSKYL